MWFNIDTRGHKKAQKRQNIAVGPEDPLPQVITRIQNPGSERVNKAKLSLVDVLAQLGQNNEREKIIELAVTT